MTGAPELKQVRVGLAIVVAKGRILIAKRKKSDSFGGFWEFPGGKCEATESLEECVRREVAEELAIEVTPVQALKPIEYRYPNAVVTLFPFVCRHDSGEPVALCASEVRWVEPSGLGEFKFPPANVPLVELLSVARFADGGAIDLPVGGA
ncbi:MAG: mutT [Phycisphaerales bacterium]|nr:mutT [Phycisphaerales bacterium]